MADSKLYGDSLNKYNAFTECLDSQHHWVGGFCGIISCSCENFLYDLRCIDGESMQYTSSNHYGWHNDAGLASQYKPVSVGKC